MYSKIGRTNVLQQFDLTIFGQWKIFRLKNALVELVVHKHQQMVTIKMPLYLYGCILVTIVSLALRLR